MCLHETVQLTDEHRIIVCGDCGREFGMIARDEPETFIAFAEPGKTILVAQGHEGDMALVVTFPEVEGDSVELIRPHAIQPCKVCGFDGSCPELEGEDCHS